MDPNREATPKEIKAAICLGGIVVGLIVGLTAIGANLGKGRTSGVPGQEEAPVADRPPRIA